MEDTGIRLLVLPREAWATSVVRVAGFAKMQARGKTSESLCGMGHCREPFNPAIAQTTFLSAFSFHLRYLSSRGIVMISSCLTNKHRACS